MKHLFCLLILLIFVPVQAAWKGELLLKLEGLQQPSAVAVSEAGEIFVLDGTINQIVVFNNKGKQIRTIHVSMKLPMDIHIAENKLMLADTGNHRLLLLSLAGKLLQTINLPDAVQKQNNKKTLKRGGMGNTLKEAEPTGITYQKNTIYWSDRRNHRVCQTSLINENTNCWGDYGKSDNQFRYPFMLTSDKNDYLYVVDVLNARIQIFNYRGKHFGSISAFGLLQGSLFRPNGITTDKAGSLFVSGSYRGTISSFKARKYTGELLDSNGKPILFKQATGIHYKNGKLYVVEMEKGRVQVFQLTEVESKSPVTPLKTKVSRQDCVTCHLEWVDDFKATETTKVPLVAEQKMCMSCHHGAVIDSRLAMMQGQQHPDYHHPLKDKDFTLASDRNTPLDDKFPLLEKTTPYCGSCHTPHARHENETGIHPDHQNSWMRQDNRQGKLCESCHADHKTDKNRVTKKNKGENHPIGIYLQKPPKESDKSDLKRYASKIRLHKGLPKLLKQLGGKTANKQAMTCESCHLLHGAKDKSLLLKKDTALCAECHQKQESKNRKTAHKKGIHPVHIKPEKKMTLNNKKVEQVECKSCHDVHGGMAKTALLHKTKTPNDSCEDCHSRQYSNNKKHARKKGIHPIHEKLKKTVKLSAKNITHVECQSCHSVHDGKANTAALVVHEKQLCRTCHPKENNKGKKQARKKGIHPINIKLKKPVKIAGKNIHEVECQSCHSVHKGKAYTPSLAENQKQLCANCHPNEHTKDKNHARKKGVHPVNFKLDRPIKFNNKIINKIECQTCHSIHNGKAYTPSLINKDANQLCASCHPRQHANNLKQARKKGVHPVNIKLDKPVKIAAKQVKELQCLSCHSVHHGKPNTPALVEEHKNGKLCQNCHKPESAVIYSDHNMQRTAKKSHNLNKETPMQAGVCGSCHSLHKAPKGADKLFVGSGIGPLARKVLKRDRSCFACHRDKGIAKEKQVKLYTHPQRDLLLKSNPAKFPLVDKYGNTKAEGQIACITCHNPHRWMPTGGKHSTIRKGQNEEGNVLNSFLRHKSPQGSFCTECHGIESQIRFKYFHDKRGRPGYARYIK